MPASDLVRLNLASDNDLASESEREKFFEMGQPESVTKLLLNWNAGDHAALNQLMPLVYDELRKLASSYLRRERVDHTLQPTALVNEAYLRLIDQTNVQWQNRAQFFGIAANLMRQILVDHARQHNAEKRGGADRHRLSLTHADLKPEQPEIDLLALNEALEELARLDTKQARIVELKFFGGLTIEETAEVMGISHATIERDWKMARAWLRRELS
ncbi:MAG TPA: sigma-70 family RNA polymerase sigma factor [Pyrinomonadaceae bacterium]|nr:sigma-70 family RNA polymerase sigma factor [Pyrinomonadaceae bacterium]